MKISVDENRNILLEEVYNPVVLKTQDGEKLSICMRDSGFEFAYEGLSYSAQRGRIIEMLGGGNVTASTDHNPGQVPG